MMHGQQNVKFCISWFYKGTDQLVFKISKTVPDTQFVNDGV